MPVDGCAHIGGDSTVRLCRRVKAAIQIHSVATGPNAQPIDRSRQPELAPDDILRLHLRSLIGGNRRPAGRDDRLEPENLEFTRVQIGRKLPRLADLVRDATRATH